MRALKKCTKHHSNAAAVCMKYSLWIGVSPPYFYLVLQHISILLEISVNKGLVRKKESWLDCGTRLNAHGLQRIHTHGIIPRLPALVQYLVTALLSLSFLSVLVKSVVQNRRRPRHDERTTVLHVLYSTRAHTASSTAFSAY